MSRIFIVTGLALFLILGLPPERATAQFVGGEGGYGRGGYGGEFGGYGSRPSNKKSDRKVSTTISISESAKRIEEILDEQLKTPLQFEAQPVNEVITLLQAEYDFPILFDMAALEEVAISPDTEISINLRNISLRSALNLIFSHPGLSDLTFVVDEELLLITSKEIANSKLVVQSYRVDDLIKGYSQELGGTNENPYSSLIQVICGTIEHDSWMANGRGEGEIFLMKPDILVVSQTNRVQRQVQELLELLRQMRKEMDSE